MRSALTCERQTRRCPRDFTIGHRQGKLAMSLGTLFTPEQALKIGMVDELVDVDNVLEKSQQMEIDVKY